MLRWTLSRLRSGQKNCRDPCDRNTTLPTFGRGILSVARSLLNTSSDSGVNFEKYVVAFIPLYLIDTIRSNFPLLRDEGVDCI